jgi:hypothetical protein
LLHVNPSEIEPLMLEIFDLKWTFRMVVIFLSFHRHFTVLLVLKMLDIWSPGLSYAHWLIPSISVHCSPLALGFSMQLWRMTLNFFLWNWLLTLNSKHPESINHHDLALTKK